MPGRSGRGGRGRGGGRGRSGRGGKSGKSSSNKGSKSGGTGLCKELSDHTFSYGNKGSADQALKTWEVICTHVGREYGTDIQNELVSESRLTLTLPDVPESVKRRHAQELQTLKTNHEALRKAKQELLDSLSGPAATDKAVRVQYVELQNEIRLMKLNEPTEDHLTLTPQESAQLKSEQKAMSVRIAELAKHRGKVYNLILGQCSEDLKSELKHQENWSAVSGSTDPLELYALITKVVQHLTVEKYPPAVVVSNLRTLLGFQQHGLHNDEYREKFDTKVTVGTSVGVSYEHKACLDFETELLYGEESPPVTKFSDLTDDDRKAKVREAAEQRLLAYLFIINSGPQFAKFRADLRDQYAMGDHNIYPATPEEAFHKMQLYSKTPAAAQPISEGSSFAQKGGKQYATANLYRAPYDKSVSFDLDYWYSRQCRICKETGHPNYACNDRDKSKDRDHQGGGGGGGGGKKKKKQQISNDKKIDDIATVVTQLVTKQAAADAQTSGSAGPPTGQAHAQTTETPRPVFKWMGDDDSSHSSHCQFGTQLEVGQVERVASDQEIAGVFERIGMLNVGPFNRISQAIRELGDNTLYSRVERMFASPSADMTLDLRKVILLDNQSTCSIFCNEAFMLFVKYVNRGMSLNSNGGNLMVNHRGKTRYFPLRLWFDNRAIANIIGLKDCEKVYEVSYHTRKTNKTFIVHRTGGLPAMIFKQRPCGLHYFDPKDPSFLDTDASFVMAP